METHFEDRNGVLVRRLKSRDPKALEDLYVLYGRILYSSILRIVNNPGVAEDLVQDTFLRAWNRSVSLDDRYESVGPWLVSIARNCALDYRKSFQCRLSSKFEVKESRLPSVRIEDELFTSDEARLLRAAFCRLSPDQRLVIDLGYYEGLSQSAIARRIHRPLGTVKTWTRSALSILQCEFVRSLFNPTSFRLKAS